MANQSNLPNKIINKKSHCMNKFSKALAYQNTANAFTRNSYYIIIEFSLEIGRTDRFIKTIKIDSSLIID